MNFKWLVLHRMLGLAACLLIGCASGPHAFAAVAAPTTTTLSMSYGGDAITSGASVAWGGELILVATVGTGSGKVTTGQVNFCEANATYCTDINLLATAQLTSAGTATLRFHPGIGAHSYKAVFIGTPHGTTVLAGGSSASAMLTVTGTHASNTQITQTGAIGDYSLMATVSGVVDQSSVPTPTGTISFLDSAGGSSSLGEAALTAAPSSLAFNNSITLMPKQEANTVATADLNGDGIPDLAVSDANSGQTTLAIYLGNGDGTFTATQTSPTVGQYPDSIAVGDFNSDGIPDLAVSSVDNNIVSILIGNGDGTFTAGANLNTGSTPQSVTAEDFNMDGIPDLVVVVNGSTNEAFILTFLGNGDGTFQAPLIMPVQAIALVKAAAGDFNRDGIPDIAATNSLENGTLLIFLGKGDGTFQTTPTTYPAGSSPVGIAVADFNHDGALDLAVSDYDGSTAAVMIFLGNGDGTFKAGAGYSSQGFGFQSLAVQDFNGDGIADLAVGQFWSGIFSTFLGKGDGTFDAAKLNNAYAQLGSGYVASADFNGDGTPDLALPSQDSTVPIVLGQLEQTATASITNVSPNGPGPHQVVASYPGDSVYGSSVSASTTLLVQAANPVFSLSAGTYTQGQMVSISDTTPGVTIYYYGPGTVGYVPYTGPFALSYLGSDLVSAYAEETGYLSSGVANLTYQVNAAPTAIPRFAPPAGTYTATQNVTLSDATAGAVIYYTTNGTLPTTLSTLYAGPIAVSASETIEAVAVANGLSPSGVATAAYIITPPASPAPMLASMSPAFVSEGSASFALTITGSGFTSGSIVYWGATALSTQFVSATQITAQVPAAQVAAAGMPAITVQTPAPGGGTSNTLTYEIDSATAGSIAPPTFNPSMSSIPAGATANYPVTLPSSATAVSARCLNLPSGAACSYSASSGAVTISTSSSTPSGTYQVTVVFTETEPVVASAIALPFLLTPLLFLRKRLRSTRLVLSACLAVFAVAAMACLTACGGTTVSGSTPSQSSSPQPTPTTATQQVTSSGVISLIVN